MLIRPDGHVAWRHTTEPATADTLAGVVHTITARARDHLTAASHLRPRQRNDAAPRVRPSLVRTRAPRLRRDPARQAHAPRRRSPYAQKYREDLLWLDGRSLLDTPQADRRRLLERLHQLSDGTLDLLPSFPAADLDDLLAGCEDLQLEGVVLKRSASRYRAGRSRDWRKVKTEAWRTHHLPHRHQLLHPQPAQH